MKQNLKHTHYITNLILKNHVEKKDNIASFTN